MLEVIFLNIFFKFLNRSLIIYWQFFFFNTSILNELIWKADIVPAIYAEFGHFNNYLF